MESVCPLRLRIRKRLRAQRWARPASCGGLAISPAGLGVGAAVRVAVGVAVGIEVADGATVVHENRNPKTVSELE